MFSAIVTFALVLSQDTGPALTCSHMSPPVASVTTRTLQNGVVAKVTRRADPDASEDACAIEVRDASGRVLFSEIGFDTALDTATGRDIDNDGSPDIVVAVDQGGGNRCCWQHTILSMKPAPHVVGAFEYPHFEIDRDGRTTIWTVVPFYDLGWSMADSPTIVVADQYRAGKLVDITKEYCDSILAGKATGVANLSFELADLTPLAIAQSRGAEGKPSYDAEMARVAASTMALQMIYCGKESDARALIARVWPERDQEETRARLSKAAASVKPR